MSAPNLIPLLREQHQAILEDYKDLLRRCLPYLENEADVSLEPDGFAAKNDAASLWSDIQHALRQK